MTRKTLGIQLSITAHDFNQSLFSHTNFNFKHIMRHIHKLGAVGLYLNVSVSEHSFTFTHARPFIG